MSWFTTFSRYRLLRRWIGRTEFNTCIHTHPRYICVGQACYYIVVVSILFFKMKGFVHACIWMILKVQLPSGTSAQAIFDFNNHRYTLYEECV